MRLSVLFVLLSLAACSQQTTDALFPPKQGVRIRIYPERAAHEFQLNVQDTRGGAAGTYVDNQRMDAMAYIYCHKQDRAMEVVSRGKFYMRDNLSTTLWFRCVSNTPTLYPEHHHCRARHGNRTRTVASHAATGHGM